VSAGPTRLSGRREGPYGAAIAAPAHECQQRVGNGRGTVCLKVMHELRRLAFDHVTVSAPPAPPKQHAANCRS
jgi:hypothetical protein